MYSLMGVLYHLKEAGRRLEYLALEAHPDYFQGLLFSGIAGRRGLPEEMIVEKIARRTAGGIVD
jgi:hypothetical protein